MNIAVVAANGRTGRAFVKAALAAGHTVRAGSLRTGSFEQHPLLTESICDATIEADLVKLIAGQDAVASFIGHVKGSQPDVQTVAINKIITVLHDQNVHRIVSLTGTGVRFPGDTITMIDRVLNLAIGIIDPPRVTDGRLHVEALKKSGLDWTVIRVLKLQNTAPQPFTLREHGPTKLFVSREEVAKAAVQVLEENSFIRQAPIISN